MKKPLNALMLTVLGFLVIFIAAKFIGWSGKIGSLNLNSAAAFVTPLILVISLLLSLVFDRNKEPGTKTLRRISGVALIIFAIGFIIVAVFVLAGIMELFKKDFVF